MGELSVSELTTYRWTFEEDVHHYAAAGIKSIGVWRQKLSDFGEEKGIELIKDMGLTVSSLQWAGGFTGSDGRSYKDSVQDARDAIRLAAELRAGCLIVYSGPRAGHTQIHAYRLLKNALQDVLPLAEEHGIKLAVEPMHFGCAAEWTFLTDLDATLQLIDELNSRYVQLAFDTYHLAHDEQTVERLPQLVDRIAVVQLGDAVRPPDGEQCRVCLGQGCLPLHQVIRRLGLAGYQGDFEIELIGEEIEATDYHDVIMKAKTAFNILMA